MGTFWVYLKLELKRAVRFLPWSALGAAALAGLLGAAALFASQILSGGREITRLQVGVVLPEYDRAARQAVSMLGSLDSVETICDFVYVGEDEGIARTESGDLDCLMAVPENFVGSIMDGSNEPVTILFDGQPGLEERIFQELTRAGAETLGSAQAGIYAADRYCILLGTPETIPAAEQWLNERYLAYGLDRTAYFRNRQVSAFGEVSAVCHYGAAAAVFGLLLCGIPAAGLFRRENPALREKLTLAGIGRVRQTAGAVTGMWLLLAASAAAVAAAAWAVSAVLGLDWWDELTGILRENARGTAGSRLILLAVLLFAAAALITLCYRAAGAGIGGMMALFGLTAGMMFFSGGFLPEVFLPESFRQIARFLPTTVLMDGMKRFFLPEEVWRNVLLTALTGGIAFALSCAGRREGR